MQYEVTYRTEWTVKVEADTELQAKERGLDKLGIDGESVVASAFPDRIELKVTESGKAVG